MNQNNLSQRVEAVRRFNRFYTRQIGILDEGYLRSPFPLAEARVIYELAQHEQTTATELGSQLGLPDFLLLSLVPLAGNRVVPGLQIGGRRLGGTDD